jgi:hypothetical protein
MTGARSRHRRRPRVLPAARRVFRRELDDDDDDALELELVAAWSAGVIDQGDDQGDREGRP